MAWLGSDKGKWKRGDKVKLLKDVRGFANCTTIPAGTVVKIWRLERVQDGCEIYSFYYDNRIFAVNMEKLESV